MMPGMPGMMMNQAQFSAHPKHRLLQGAAPLQPPAPPAPVIKPLQNLCQYPQGETGSVTVTLDDYKTLAAGTFLNDTIIDFYLKFLLFSKFSEDDKNR